LKIDFEITENFIISQFMNGTISIISIDSGEIIKVLDNLRIGSVFIDE
jgi:hypothetical protein